ncbi:unnamed protein product [Enterobius vermicularis]|uniref:Transmembrane protein n=1 Tax=Enterobius vermicularis TaxID=51028 RepID=A0A0N4VDQ0_ENTVE|nr:unnamed protein product [Enterobius vermicularis]
MDVIVGLLGMGAAFWTKKPAFAFPCAIVQPLLIVARIFAWIFINRLPKEYRTEDLTYVILEFVFPSLWFILSIGTTFSLCKKETEKKQPLRQTPKIVVYSTKTDNEESVQFEINP